MSILLQELQKRDEKLLVRLCAVEVAVRYAVEERKVGVCVLLGGGFPVPALAPRMWGLGERGTYRSSTR